MKTKIFFIIVVLLVGSEIKSQTTSIPLITLDQINNRLTTGGDTMYVVNFWATWCKPCIEELPFLIAVDNKEFENYPVKLLLISLDFPDQIEKRLIPFLNKKNITSEVLVLDEKNANRWIPLVNSSWSGAIPATIFRHKLNKQFFEGSLNSQLVNDYLTKTLKL